jgi:hypothetical protein
MSGAQIRALARIADTPRSPHQPAITTEHSKQLELDGQHIRQIAMIVEEQNAEVQKMTNGIQALLELSARHQTRISRLEGEH